MSLETRDSRLGATVTAMMDKEAVGGEVSKLIRKYSAFSGVPEKELKKQWNSLPARERYELRMNWLEQLTRPDAPKAAAGRASLPSVGPEVIRSTTAPRPGSTPVPPAPPVPPTPPPRPGSATTPLVPNPFSPRPAPPPIPPAPPRPGSSPLPPVPPRPPSTPVPGGAASKAGRGLTMGKSLGRGLKIGVGAAAGGLLLAALYSIYKRQKWSDLYGQEPAWNRQGTVLGKANELYANQQRKVYDWFEKNYKPDGQGGWTGPNGEVMGNAAYQRRLGVALQQAKKKGDSYLDVKTREAMKGVQYDPNTGEPVPGSFELAPENRLGIDDDYAKFRQKVLDANRKSVVSWIAGTPIMHRDTPVFTSNPFKVLSGNWKPPTEQEIRRMYDRIRPG